MMHASHRKTPTPTKVPPRAPINNRRQITPTKPTLQTLRTSSRSPLRVQSSYQKNTPTRNKGNRP